MGELVVFLGFLGFVSLVAVVGVGLGMLVAPRAGRLAGFDDEDEGGDDD